MKYSLQAEKKKASGRSSIVHDAPYPPCTCGTSGVYCMDLQAGLGRVCR